MYRYTCWCTVPACTQVQAEASKTGLHNSLFQLFVFLGGGVDFFNCESYWQFKPKRLNTKRAGPARLLLGLAGADLIFWWIGMVEYILCYGGPAEHWGPLPATRLASRKILIQQNIKKRTGPFTLCTLWFKHMDNVNLLGFISTR
jgi:hypothetical protein